MPWTTECLEGSIQAPEGYLGRRSNFGRKCKPCTWSMGCEYEPTLHTNWHNICVSVNHTSPKYVLADGNGDLTYHLHKARNKCQPVFLPVKRSD